MGNTVDLSKPIGSSKWWKIGLFIVSAIFIVPISLIFVVLYFILENIAFLIVSILFSILMILVIVLAILLMVVVSRKIRKKVDLDGIASAIGAEVHLASFSNPFVTPTLIGNYQDSLNKKHFRLTLSRVVRRTVLQAIADETIRADVLAAGLMNSGSEWKIPTGSYMSWNIEIESNSGLEGGISTRMPLTEKAAAALQSNLIESGDEEFDRQFMINTGKNQSTRNWPHLVNDDQFRKDIAALLSVSRPYASSISFLPGRIAYRFVITDQTETVSVWKDFRNLCERYRFY